MDPRIERLRDEVVVLRERIDRDAAIIEGISKENTKLKVEIEQLKESRNYISEVNGSLVRINNKQDREITKLKDKIEQLKAESEQSVKLPLTNADKIHSMSDEELAEFIQDIHCDNHGNFVNKLLSKSSNPICITEMLKQEVHNDKLRYN